MLAERRLPGGSAKIDWVSIGILVGLSVELFEIATFAHLELPCNVGRTTITPMTVLALLCNLYGGTRA